MDVLQHIVNRVVKYIGRGVHGNSTAVVVLDARGKLLMRVTLRTEAPAASSRAFVPLCVRLYSFLTFAARGAVRIGCSISDRGVPQADKPAL